MAWPKLRNKSSGPLMTVSNRSGAAHDGARSQGKAPEGAPEGPAPPERSGRATPAAEPASEPAAELADPPKPEWKPVITPVEEAGEPRPGAGQRRGNLAYLSANPRMRIWQLRVVVAVVILVAFWILVSWQLGLT